MPDAKKPGHDPRLAATRLAAVQAVYELDMMSVPVDDVLAEFAANRWQAVDEEIAGEMAKPKPELFKDMVRGVAGARVEIEDAIKASLDKRWTFEEMEALMLALLQVAAFEFMQRRNVPARALISAYVGIGDAFFDADSPQAKLIAGVLNGLARALRAEEFSNAG